MLSIKRIWHFGPFFWANGFPTFFYLSIGMKLNLLIRFRHHRIQGRYIGLNRWWWYCPHAHPTIREAH